MSTMTRNAKLDAILAKIVVHYNDLADIDSNDNPNDAMENAGFLGGYLSGHVSAQATRVYLAEMIEEMESEDEVVMLAEVKNAHELIDGMLDGPAHTESMVEWIKADAVRAAHARKIVAWACEDMAQAGVMIGSMIALSSSSPSVYGVDWTRVASEVAS